MVIEPKMPEKVKYLMDFSFPLVTKLCAKTPKEQFVGGRPRIDRQVLFFWLLVKKVTNWDYRTIASMAGVSHPTLIRANDQFLKKQVYEKVLMQLVVQAHKQGYIGKYVALDSSFIHTFSKKGEVGSEGWNEFKKAYGFKLHLLVDCETQCPFGLCVTNGLANDMTLAVPLLKKARRYLKRCEYVVADKGYDWGDLVNWIGTELGAKAGIPIKKVPKRGKNYTWEASYRNFQLKAKGRTLKKSIYNKRSSIERVFSTLKRTYHLGKEETRGILNFAKNTYLALICYMLKLFYIANST